MKIENICALEKIKKLKDNSQDIIYADPPYALGSTVLIGKDGKPYYKEARDFMSKWEMPDEKFWEEFFKEANRVLKYGGRVLFFGIDRQLFLFQYYAVASGLEIKQSLYWYFISNFPKATDLSKQIEKRLGVEQIGSEKPDFGLENADKGYNTVHNKLIMPDTQTDLGKKYEGFKYSISPLKQVLETAMVFQKPTKNKSVLDDVFAYEEGDLSISPSIWGIDEGRVPSETTTDRIVKGNSRDNTVNIWNEFQTSSRDANTDGRFPSQLFIDKECASKIDEQSGELTSGARKSSYVRRGSNPNETYGKFNEVMMDDAEKDSGGASRILHRIEYLNEELDLVIYSPKVSTFEREVGCGSIEETSHNTLVGAKNDREREDLDDVGARFKSVPKSNSHPTLKPIKLNYQIFKLLKTPNPQNVFFPFSGAGSEIIGAIQAGFDSDLFECSEISEEFVAISEARVKTWKNLDINDLESSKKHIEKLSKEDSRQGSLF